MINLANEINNATALNSIVSASFSTNTLILSGSSAGTGYNSITLKSGSYGGTIDKSIITTEGGTNSSATGNSFQLKTFSHGTNQNNNGTVGQSNNILLSGSKDNVRWEISSINEAKGTFTLLIRKGNDTIKNKQILETWNNLSLDPNASNYISKIIGDSYESIDGTNSFIEYVGNYPAKSKYVYVSSVDSPTSDYLDENGNVRLNEASQSLPSVGSGSADGAFSGGTDGYSGFDGLGNPQGYANTATCDFFENIGTDNSQGFKISSTSAQDGGSSYTEALDLLANADEYDINMLLVPGICDSGAQGGHAGIITKAVDTCEKRGDCFVIYDAVTKGSTIATVTDRAKAKDSNYAATYWPWVQVHDAQTGAFRWVPPSAVMPGIYAFNDKVAAPWFAPAGLNRGGLDTVIQAERKLTHANRDTLYESNVNPIATFPGQGVVVWGQKTLQKKSSALDRVNVRRLLIKVKKFIAASSRFLVFEQNNAQTRERFLNIANPYLEQVQAQSGLNAFRVVMDDTNNTPDIVDRNILYGQIFLQPTKTAEFIVLDFTIQPTGATFPE